MGTLHMINQTLADWYSKRQLTIETATCGSELVAAWQTATQQVIDIGYTLHIMVVPIAGPAYIFGDNESVITCSRILHSMFARCSLIIDAEEKQ